MVRDEERVRSVLEKLGLSLRDIDTYLALLRTGPTTASHIAETTGIDRATTYRYLNNLKKQGLASEHERGGVKHYKAASPTTLRDQVREHLDQVDSILPVLQEQMRGSEADAEVELYTGKDGVKTMLQDIIRVGEDYTHIGREAQFLNRVPHAAQRFINSLEDRGMQARLLWSEERDLPLGPTEELRIIGDEYTSQISTVTYSDNTAQFIWSKPPHGIIIRSEDVTQSNKDLFDYLWSKAEEPKHSSE